MYRNPVALFFLAAIPGLGHFAVNRKGRAFVYPFLFFGIIGCGFFLSISVNDGGPFFFGLFLSAIVWTANMIDMVVYLLRHPVPRDMGYERDKTELIPASPSNGNETGERFYTILLSLIPGLGHLHLGLMQRGLTLLVGFFGLLTMIVFIAVLTDQPGFLAFLGALPVIWLFGMVDAVRLAGRKQNGETLRDSTILEDWDNHRESGRRSRVVATLLSVFPGAGHMYLGLQRRGLQLMAGFMFSIYLLDALNLTLFLFLVPLIWFYAFFDGLQHSSKYETGSGELEDVPVVQWLMNRQKWVGIGLLALGLFYLFDQLALDWIQEYFNDRQLTRQIERYVQTGLVAVLLIGGGIRLLIGSGRKGGRPQ